ncbi:MAG TPA: MerR family transcriptional regulator [Gaiellaceae bacterium]|nr:MerR family transcriptional regulator [Gaiellaceae bacterium]
MATAATEETGQGGGRALTIGAVCRRLRDEFPDISISKIRYLEDQGLLAPRRTQGGYRLFTEEDVERLATILRLQRDEFLPLRVIRQELAAGAPERRERTRRAGLRVPEDEVDLATLCERAGVDAAFVRDLEDFGLVEPHAVDGDKRFPERDVDVAAACARLARYGVAPRNLATFRRWADNEADLLERIVAPELRSPNPEKRHAGLENLETLAALSQELSNLLFWRALRGIVPKS